MKGEGLCIMKGEGMQPTHHETSRRHTAPRTANRPRKGQVLQSFTGSISPRTPLRGRCRMEETMQVRRITWLMRTIGALGLTAAVAAGADARSTMGYNAFRPWQSPAAQDCVYEDYGGARNDCPADKTLVFETVVDNAGWHGIQAVSLGNGRPFDCYAQSYAQAAYTQDTGIVRQAF